MKQLLNQRFLVPQSSAMAEVTEMAARYGDVINLSIGDPDIPTPRGIIQQVYEDALAGHTKYTDPRGYPELRQAIRDFYREEYGDQVEDQEVFVTASGVVGMYLAMQVLLDPGDEVIIPTPSFVCYSPLVSMAHGTPVLVETKAEHEFRLTPEELRGAITPRTKALVLPFPCNPTGGVMGRADLEALADVLRGTDIMVISDEIYAELTYGGRHVSMANLPDMYERTVVVNGFSKAYSMTGWRLGYVCGPKPIISAMTKLHQYGIMSAPTTSQYAAIEALDHGDGDIEAMREEYDGRRRFLVEGFRRLGLSCFEPLGAFYTFPCIKSTGLTSEQFCDRFLAAEKVAVIPGSAFGPGGEGYVRATYAASMHDLGEALERLERFLDSLKSGLA